MLKIIFVCENDSPIIEVWEKQKHKVINDLMHIHLENTHETLTLVKKDNRTYNARGSGHTFLPPICPFHSVMDCWFILPPYDII